MCCIAMRTHCWALSSLKHRFWQVIEIAHKRKSLDEATAALGFPGSWAVPCLAFQCP